MNLITGATGLVGSYIARYLLLQGESVRALKRKNSNLILVNDIKEKIEWVEGDILDIISVEDAMEGVENIYHAAGFISYSKIDRNTLIKTNAQGTANIVNVSLEKKINKLLYISSIAAIGRNKDAQPVTENIPWEKTRNISDYSLSKFLAEREVWRGIAEGLNAVILNPSIIIGAGNFNTGSSKLFSTIYNGFKFYTEGVTGYVDVRDVAKLSYALINSNIHAERLIINSENMCYRDYFFMIADALHVKRPFIKAGKFLSEIAWRAEGLKSMVTGHVPAVTKYTAAIANKIVYFDNGKITNAMKYSFIPIEQSVRETSAVYKNYLLTGKIIPLSFAT